MHFQRSRELNPHGAETCVPTERKHCNADSSGRWGIAVRTFRRTDAVCFYTFFFVWSHKTTLYRNSQDKHISITIRGLRISDFIATRGALQRSQHPRAKFGPPAVFSTYYRMLCCNFFLSKSDAKQYADTSCKYTLKYFNHTLAADSIDEQLLFHKTYVMSNVENPKIRGICSVFCKSSFT